MSGSESELSRLVEELNRSTRPVATASQNASLDRLLTLAVQRGASDILLVANSTPAVRVKGQLLTQHGKSVSSDELRSLLRPLLTDPQLKELEHRKSLDFCFVRSQIGRFRANLHYQRGTLAASIRLLPAQIPTLESLNLPPALAQFVERRQGLVLLTGPTGCGKTSTLAAMLGLINARRRDHIITIEDPIEYEHGNQSSIVEQIEVGHDTPSFADAVRASLRQDPDVILIGEMRDADTMSAALTAAETGHLVLSSLHTNDTSQTISRILDIFPAGHQSQIRQQLSLALLAIITQQLVPSADGSVRYPAVEILMGTPAIRNLIRTAQDHQIRSNLATGRADGMVTMEQSLAQLVTSGRITRDTAMAHSYNPVELRQYLKDPGSPS
jgi:twitching motility protein PilT